MNATMRRIDLFCKLASPVFVSLLTIASSPFAAWFLFGSNLISLPFEYYFILVVYRRFPDLAIKPPRQSTRSQTLLRRLVRLPARTVTSWRIYYQSPLFAASLSLSILYFTVLSFGGMCRDFFHADIRFHDRFSLAIFRFLKPPHRRPPCHRGGRWNWSNIPGPTSNTLHWRS